MLNYSIDTLGELSISAAFRNLAPARLVELALKNGEGLLSESGAFVVNTGAYTGRAAKDRYIVDTAGVHEAIAWGEVNRPISRENAHRLEAAALDYMHGRELYVFDGFAGADKRYRHSFRVITELASQSLFVHQLLIRPEERDLAEFKPDYTVIALPRFQAAPELHGTRSRAAVILDLERHLVVIAGTQYAGEIKKSVFTVMNYLLPAKEILPMHCSANIGPAGDTAVFFGLSGTGKTTLSTDPERRLIGDDEHGWADDSIFNFEGGCYAKCAHLSEKSEPDIYRAIRFGALVENVVMDGDSRRLDYDDLSLTENTRVGYPLDHIGNIQPSGMSDSVPRKIIFLAADAYGVLPPVSRLTKHQAMYYFASGYTAKVAGTENGIIQPVPAFSACFGEPFMPLDLKVYVHMLAEKIESSGAQVYLINTGWNGRGERVRLAYTRAMVRAALGGGFDNAQFEESCFGLSVPRSCPGVPDEILRPESSWASAEEYSQAAEALAALFVKNIARYDGLSDQVLSAGPRCTQG